MKSQRARERRVSRFMVVQLDSFDQAQEYGKFGNDLLGVSKDNHVFLTLEWLEPWWKYLARAGRKNCRTH